MFVKEAPPKKKNERQTVPLGADDRIRRIMKLYKLEEKQALDKIKKTDRERKLYYEARTGREWGSIEANSMMFNASLLGIDGVVDALEAVLDQQGLTALCGSAAVPFLARPRRQEIFACFNRFRGLEL